MKPASALIILLLLSGCALVERQAALMKDPLTAEEHNNLGVAYESEGKYDLALREYGKALDADGSLVAALVNMGNVHYKTGKFGEAEESYLKALKRDKTNIPAANNLASLYIALDKNFDKGLEYLAEATGNTPDTPAYALDTLGVLYMRLGDEPKAAEMFKRACLKAAGDENLIREIESHIKESGQTCAGLSDP